MHRAEKEVHEGTNLSIAVQLHLPFLVMAIRVANAKAAALLGNDDLVWVCELA
jgi:hypothetical protein